MVNKKEEYFERVVTWKQIPIRLGVFLSVCFLLAGLLTIVGALLLYINSLFTIIIWLSMILAGTASIILGIEKYNESKGIDRKILWRKIK